MTTLFSSLLAFGDNVNLAPSDQFSNLNNVTFASFVRAAIVLVLVVAAIIFFFMLVFGGIKWITSGGDKGQTEAARNQITAALIGLVIVFSAWAILQIVGTFFQIDLFNLNLVNAVGTAGGGGGS
jgi:hypothetical protein